MAGNATFEPASTSSSELGFSGSYLNGQRGARSAPIGPNLVRSGNFREGSERRMFGSGFATPRGGTGISQIVASGDFRTLSQCISLEPIVIHDQISLYDEINMVISAGENSHVKPMLPVTVVKDLKRFRSSVEDTCVKARVRANKMCESLCNLDKYCESVTVKKQQKSELMSNDRPGAVNLKTGAQIYSVNQRIEDQPKNILLNKRVRTSVAESRAEYQNNGLQMQPVAIEKDGGNSDLFEKIRKLAAGGEGWDKKIKRKRSVGMVFTRPADNDGVPKGPVQNKIVNDTNYRLNNRDDSLNNKKRPMLPASSSPPMAQWAGQRPQKMARLKKPNLVPSVSNQDQNLLSFQNHSPSDYSSPISKNTTNGTQKVMVKLENIQSSPRLSENEEFIVGENRLKMEKKMGNSGIDAVVKKNKPPINAAATQKPFQSSKTSYKKNGSKPGRRLKKLSDRKGFSHNASLQNSRSPDCAGASVDDQEELLAAANHARVASYLACSSGFWKKMEPVFAPISSENKSLLSQQLNKDSTSDPVSCGTRNPEIQHEETESFSGRHDSSGPVPFYQRVLSALIIEENDNNTHARDDSRNTHYQNNFHQNENKSFHSNGNINFSEMSLDDRVLLELQSIGLCLDAPTLPSLDNEEDETIHHEVDNLKSRLYQQEVKKKEYLEKICKGVESNSAVRDLETRAMDRLVELAYRKLLQASRRSSRSVIPKIPKQAALSFVKRTLARCHKFEKSGSSCFNEPKFQQILNVPMENDPDLKLLSDNGLATNRGKKKELFLEDIGTGSSTKSRKPKPKQKTGRVLTAGSNGPRPVDNPTTTRSLHPTGPTYPSSVIPGGQSTNNTRIDELDPLDDLGGGDLVGPADLNSFLNFDDQDMDVDFAGGLDIPMDDLTELF